MQRATIAEVDLLVDPVGQRPVGRPIDLNESERTLTQQPVEDRPVDSRTVRAVVYFMNHVPSAEPR